MLLWLQEVFCSTQILDQNLALDLRINKPDNSRASENKELCEHERLQQKSQETTKTEDEYVNNNQFSSNLLTDCTGNDLNRRYKNVDYDLFNFSSSTAASNDLMTHSGTRNTFITNVSKEQYCASEESRNDTKCLKTSNSGRTDTSEHSYLNKFWNDDNNLLSTKKSK
ncbi:hypothetical protein NCER_102611 [Vairimorpha ceranae BRL01]|uniref:Uncharacterized protein n=1 Tax=Vairimorpha ceranae (strain BRL01) TaxID=578460 RepID=C4VC96_VAIC1|nr:hypothetical protein NCER_102611 [Vairimorpha ceranae BRL01]